MFIFIGTELTTMQEITRNIDDFEKALLSLDQNLASSIVSESLVHRSLPEVCSEVITESLNRIGLGWEQGLFSLSQVYMAGTMCEKIIDEILPSNSKEWKDQPKTAIGVFEDYHMLGKRIIYSSLRASGIKLLDLGGGLSVDKTLELVKKHDIKVLLLSVLMPPSALKIADLVKKLEGQDIKIIVGGAPFRFDSELGNEIGVFATGRDSADALKLMHKIIGEKS
ncbi:MAG: cobalamin-binding protein [Bacteroidetes bacterium]|nr:cobalamin-binding protein [Bacteroidota bacterium]MBT4412069.1 cobalamin-binding protein [Bacteroidota bacterium]MBT5425552.1 cobalamin-binding protein [Bacteroidota bacterium]MBT7463539.1 cobalamin-binding protein [Bacteroidota bacterium]